MRVAERALWPAVQRRMAADRLNGRHLQRLALVQRRQQPWQAAGEQGLASAGRAGEQQVVRPGCGQQQCTLGRHLALYLAEVGVGPAVQYQAIGGIGR